MERIVFTVLLLHAALFVPVRAQQCPAECNCANYATIKEIRCDNRELHSVPLNLPADTQTLRLEFNKITSITAGDFANLVNLKRLTLYNNKISFIDPAAFQSLVNLEVLRMQSNSILHIDSQTFRGMHKLDRLNLDNNFLTTLQNGTFQDTVKLAELTMPGNPLETLPDGVFVTLSNLHLLDISNVHFAILSPTLFHGLANLRSLKLNNITRNGNVTFANEKLFAGTPGLISLQVEQNTLTCIPDSFSALTRVERLYLSRNSMNCEDLTSGIRHMRNLVELHLQNTKVQTLKSGMFAATPNITYLDITETKLSEIEEGAFEGLTHLEELYLYLNNLTTLPRQVLAPLPNNATVDLSDNPWHCDCNLRWLHEWIQGIGSDYPITCASPERLRDREVAFVPASDFACSPESHVNNTAYSVIQGDDFTMRCGIFGDPSPVMHWLTPDHTELFTGTRHGPFIVDDNAVLTIIRIRHEDAGAYSCIGNNVAGSLTVRHTVTVRATGHGRSTPITLSRASSATTFPTLRTVPGVPLTGANSINTAVVVTCIVTGIVVILLLIIAMLCFMRINRRKRSNGGMENGLVVTNEPITGRNCQTGCANAVAYHEGNVRYQASLPRPPAQSSFDSPPPYSTHPQPTEYEEIYDQIKDEENAYERPREPGEISPQNSCHLQHTYMSKMDRQASKLTESSCGAPCNYERSLIRDNFRLQNQYSIDSALPRDVAMDSSQTESPNAKILPKNVTEDDFGVVDLDPHSKVTYQNTRRP